MTLLMGKVVQILMTAAPQPQTNSLLSQKGSLDIETDDEDTDGDDEVAISPETEADGDAGLP